MNFYFVQLWKLLRIIKPNFISFHVLYFFNFGSFQVCIVFLTWIIVSFVKFNFDSFQVLLDPILLVFKSCIC